MGGSEESPSPSLRNTQHGRGSEGRTPGPHGRGGLWSSSFLRVGVVSQHKPASGFFDSQAEGREGVGSRPQTPALMSPRSETLILRSLSFRDSMFLAGCLWRLEVCERGRAAGGIAQVSLAA